MLSDYYTTYPCRCVVDKYCILEQLLCVLGLASRRDTHSSGMPGWVRSPLDGVNSGIFALLFEAVSEHIHIQWNPRLETLEFRPNPGFNWMFVSSGNHSGTQSNHSGMSIRNLCRVVGILHVAFRNDFPSTYASSGTR